MNLKTNLLLIIDQQLIDFSIDTIFSIYLKNLRCNHLFKASHNFLNQLEEITV